MSQNLSVHESTYKRKTLVSLVHRSRLKAIRKVFKRHIAASEIAWADFGCSNGFIIDEIVKTNEYNFSKIVGYDHVEGLLELARAKKIPKAEFRYFDMNQVGDAEQRFDLVTCFETLEHVGDPENAFMNLFKYLGQNGTMVITVPNEIGFVGLIKFLGRLATRRNPYADFFSNQSYLGYVKALLRYDFIDGFRKPSQPGYGPHLGFDYRKLEARVKERFIERKELELIERSFTGLHMNVIYLLRKQSS